MSGESFYITWSQQDNAPHFEFVGTTGSILKLKNGKEVTDLSSISYHASFGSKNPLIIKSIEKQLKEFVVASPKAIFPLKKEMSQKLIDFLQLKSGKIFYTVSGAESVENALKMARSWTQRKIILSRKNSYHGATLGAMSVSGDWRSEQNFTVDEWTQFIPEPHTDPDLTKTREIINKVGANNIAAFCLETITGGNGVIIPEKKWWEGIQSLCDEYDIKLILDEVVCGFGRTGKPFGFHHFNLRPHFVCLAKNISGGHIPFGALWTCQEVSSYYKKNALVCGLTNYAHPLGLAALRGVFEIVDTPQFWPHLKTLEALLKKKLEEINNLSVVSAYRQIGLLAAIDLDCDLNWQELMNNGLYVAIQKGRLILAPALNISQDVLSQALEKLFQVLEKKI